MSADMGSRIAVLEERSKREQAEREEMNGDIKAIKSKVYEMAASFRALKWLLTMIVPAMGGAILFLK